MTHMRIGVLYAKCRTSLRISAMNVSLFNQCLIQHNVNDIRKTISCQILEMIFKNEVTQIVEINASRWFFVWFKLILQIYKNTTISYKQR